MVENLASTHLGPSLDLDLSSDLKKSVLKEGLKLSRNEADLAAKTR